MTKAQLIKAHVKGQSFADVGGLWGTKGEMVTGALKSGARSATMLDAMAKESQWWGKFDTWAKERNATGYKKVVHDITDPKSREKVGSFDFVHCTGVLYHVSDVLNTFANLVSITNTHLLFGSEIVPNYISNQYGELTIPDDQPLMLPLISEAKRTVVSEYYRQLGVENEIGGLMRDVEFFRGPNLNPSGGPWWTLLTPGTLRRMAGRFDLEILDEISTLRTLTILARKRG